MGILFLYLFCFVFVFAFFFLIGRRTCCMVSRGLGSDSICKGILYSVHCFSYIDKYQLFCLFRPARYTVFVPDPDKHDAPSWEAGVTFLVSNFQYVIYGFVFAPDDHIGRQFRKIVSCVDYYAFIDSITPRPFWN